MLEWYEIAPLPATDEQLLQVMIACDEFRKRWGEYHAMPWEARFEGEAEDICSLDYIQYEGLRGPAGGIEVEALIWGNVLAHQLGFRWVSSCRGDLFLYHAEPDRDPGDFHVALWPLARVLEAHMARAVQFDLYAWLTNRVVAGLLETAPPGSAFEVRLRQLRKHFTDVE